jgi:3-oxoacyl-[acyl-carrier protein] reductase
VAFQFWIAVEFGKIKAISVRFRAGFRGFRAWPVASIPIGNHRHCIGKEHMDLGIKGRTAIVNAASKGLGRACAFSLAREGVNLTISARGAEALEATAAQIRADVATEAGRAAVLSASPAPDILVNNCGGPKPGSFRDWTRDDWIAAFDSNMLSAIELIKATIDPMIARKFGRIVNITSSAVKAPIGMLGLSNGARAGLTGFVAGIARQVAEHNVTINNLLPGVFDTDRVRVPLKAMAQQQGKTEDELLAAAFGQIPARRIGDPHEFGEACAFLCGAHAGYIVGQNVLMDGGQTNLTF